MRVMWLCNEKLPIVSELQGQLVSPYGGWMDQISRKILEVGHDLMFLYPTSLPESGENGQVIYQGFTKRNMRQVFREVTKKGGVDIAHIWGTELPHTLAFVEALESAGLQDRIVVSIQGLVSFIAKHFVTKLPWRVVHGFTLRDAIRGKNVYQTMLEYRSRGRGEVVAIQKVKHIIGRTEWDRACIRQINLNAAYHYCGETLRSSFYEGRWDLNTCERHTIFVSQASYPFKGFHILLEALAEIVKHFPDAKVYVAGNDPTASDGSLKNVLRRTYYGRFLNNLINKNDLENSVVFIGPLSEMQMRERYLKSHVFVSPSTIENSPNSLGEAMLLGMPCIASFVGGVPSMLRDKEEGFLYQADAPYMLAHYIMKLFLDNDLAQRVGEQARKRAIVTHDSVNNLKELLKIYSGIARKRE